MPGLKELGKALENLLKALKERKEDELRDELSMLFRTVESIRVAEEELIVDPSVAVRAEELNEYLASLNVSEVMKSSESSRAVLRRIASGVEQLVTGIRISSRRSKTIAAGVAMLLVLLDMLLLMYSNIVGLGEAVGQVLLVLSILSFVLASIAIMSALLSLYITFVVLLILASISFIELGLGVAGALTAGIPVTTIESASLFAALGVTALVLGVLLLKNRQIATVYRRVRYALSELSSRIENLARAVESIPSTATRTQIPLEQAYREFEEVLSRVYGNQAREIAGYLVDMLRIAGRDIREELEKLKRTLEA